MVKSEPDSYSWEIFFSRGGDIWDGVRNFQAKNYLSQMQVGDQVFFYHSGKIKEIVGLAEVSQENFPDPNDENWLAVKLRVKHRLKNPISLAQIKSEDRLAAMQMLRQSRLSVVPISRDEYQLLMKMSL